MIELKEYIERQNNLHDRLFCQSSINELATYFGESINDIPVDIQEQYIAGQFDLNEYLLETLKSHDSEALTKFLKKRIQVTYLRYIYKNRHLKMVPFRMVYKK